jgi:putative chitinase
MTVRITAQALQAAGIHPTQANAFADPLSAACALFAIDSPARIGSFIGQAAVESALFCQLEENLWYSTPERLCAVWPSHFASIAAAVPYVGNPSLLANYVYAGRNGNGDIASGDGSAFRGRGLIGITGRANYLTIAQIAERPYIDHPELLAQPSDACLSAAAFWQSRNLNALADAGSIDAITRAVNGPAMLQADQRRTIAAQVSLALAQSSP